MVGAISNPASSTPTMCTEEHPCLTIGGSPSPSDFLVLDDNVLVNYGMYIEDAAAVGGVLSVGEDFEVSGNSWMGGELKVESTDPKKSFFSDPTQGINIINSKANVVPGTGENATGPFVIKGFSDSGTFLAYMGFTAGTIVSNADYFKLIPTGTNKTVLVGDASSLNTAYGLRVTGDTDINGVIKNTSGTLPVTIGDDLEVSGSIKNNTPYTDPNCGFTYSCPPAGATEPVKVADSLKVTGGISGSNLSITGQISAESYEGGFSLQNFSRSQGSCLVTSSNTTLTTCSLSCTYDRDIPIFCGYNVENASSVPVSPNAVFTDYNDSSDPKCIYKMRNVSGVPQTVTMVSHCVSS